MIKRTFSVLLMVGGLLLLMLLLLPSSRVFASSSQVQMPASGFIKTCDVSGSITGVPMGVETNGTLFGYCKMANGNWHYSTLDLNIHVGNINGNLTPNKSSFVKTCPNISGSSGAGDFYLSAQCYNNSHVLHNSVLGLNGYISNSNGYLVWG